MSKEIPLTQGKFAIVDDEDFKWLSQWKWYASYDKKRDRWCAQRFVGGRANHRCVKMHREILSAAKGDIVDHLDRNALNNCRRNLRICSNTQNLRNTNGQRRRISKYKGVCKANRPCNLKKPWKAEIQVDKQRIHIGYFRTEKEAALAYDLAAIKYHGEFARLNFMRRCKVCGCTDDNACIDKKTGEPCHWVETDLCSNCECMAVKGNKNAKAKSVA